MAVVTTFESIAELGEGPHWDEKTQKLFYVDITGGNCCRLDPNTGLSETEHFEGKSVSVVIPYASDTQNLLVSITKSLYKLNWDSKQKEKILELSDGITHNRFNDGKCDPRGRLWIGTMELEGQKQEVANKLIYGLFRVDSNFKVSQHLRNIGVSNGLAWSADNNTMFYIDSIPRKVYAFDYDIENGTLGSQRVIVDFNKNEGYSDFGFPDGMTIDTEGKLWVACFEGNRIIRIDPETGALLQSLMMPASRITSCCFGGPNYDEMYVTSAHYGLTESQRMQQPHAGCVFKVTGLGVKGSPPYCFAG